MKEMKDYTIPFVGLKLGRHKYDFNRRLVELLVLKMLKELLVQIKIVFVSA